MNDCRRPTEEERLAAEELLTRNFDDYDPCGECQKGTCDECEMCLYFADPPWKPDPA